MGRPCGPWTWMKPSLCALHSGGLPWPPHPTCWLRSWLSPSSVHGQPGWARRLLRALQVGGWGEGGLQFYDGKISLKQSHHLFWPHLHAGHPEEMHSTLCPVHPWTLSQVIRPWSKPVPSPSSLSLPTSQPFQGHTEPPGNVPLIHRLLCNISQASISDPTCPQR